jgi:carboxymethylenebutenolidase
MSGRWDTVSTGDGEMRCYVAVPSGAGPFPGVIAIQHAGGVDDFVRSMTDRLAEAGFVGVAPDLYHREDPNSSDDPMTRMMRLRDRNIVPDVKAAVDHAQSLEQVDAGRIGITGFCMGGRVTYLMCASDPRFKAGVVFYGGNIMVPWGRDDPAPFELSDNIQAPVLGLFGEADPNPNPADVAKIDAELSRLGKAHEFHSYPGAGHAFMSQDRPSYREDAAKDAWTRCIAWFNQHLTA